MPGTPSSSKRAIGRERRDGDLDQAPRRRCISADLRAVLQLAAEQVLRDRPGRQFPIRRTRFRIGLRERFEFVRKLRFGMLTEMRGHNLRFFTSGIDGVSHFVAELGRGDEVIDAGFPEVPAFGLERPIGDASREVFPEPGAEQSERVDCAFADRTIPTR